MHDRAISRMSGRSSVDVSLWAMRWAGASRYPQRSLILLFLLLTGILSFSASALGSGHKTDAISKSRSTKSTGTSSPAPVPPQPTAIRVESIPPIHLQSDDGHPPSIWPPIVGPIFAAMLAFLGAWLGLKFSQHNTDKTIRSSLSANTATLWQKANEIELRSIEEKLGNFYGPIMTRLQADHMLAQDIRSRQPKGYRLLTSLFDRNWLANLPKGDQRLVALICEHAEKLEETITNAGSVDPVLIPYFSRAVAHFRILRLAYEGVLGNDPKRFELYVYPRALDHILILEIKRLRLRMAALRAEPSGAPGSIAPLIVPNEEKYALDPPWPDPDGRLLSVTSWN